MLLSAYIVTYRGLASRSIGCSGIFHPDMSGMGPDMTDCGMTLEVRGYYNTGILLKYSTGSLTTV